MTAGYCRLINRTPLYRPAAPASVSYRRDDDQQPTRPTTYDPGRHTVDAVAATSNPIRRHFGFEVLRIRRESVDLDLLDSHLPLLDSHDESKELGKVVAAWFENHQLRATLKFNSTRAGRQAEEMVSRGELTHVSCGSNNMQWSAKDIDGEKIPIHETCRDFRRWGGDASTRTFTAIKWRLAEISLTAIPVDLEAQIL